jgi:hypothetical protein
MAGLLRSNIRRRGIILLPVIVLGNVVSGSLVDARLVGSINMVQSLPLPGYHWVISWQVMLAILPYTAHYGSASVLKVSISILVACLVCLVAILILIANQRQLDLVFFTTIVALSIVPLIVLVIYLVTQPHACTSWISRPWLFLIYGG